jgi:hypothetical protein
MAVAAIALKRTLPIILSSSQALTLSGDYGHGRAQAYHKNDTRIEAAEGAADQGDHVQLKPLSDPPALVKRK